MISAVNGLGRFISHAFVWFVWTSLAAVVVVAAYAVRSLFRDLPANPTQINPDDDGS